MRLALLLLAVVATAAVTQADYEREQVIAQAIAEAKEHGKQASLTREANIQAMKSSRTSLTGAQAIKVFKKPTKQAIKQGEARLMYEDMVHRAERKLAEMERKSHAETQDAEAKAEELAKELLHTPGSLLTSDEIAHMYQESGCAEVRQPPVCDTRSLVIRTIDGTCNNIEDPLLGASGTDFTRLVPAEYEDGRLSLRGGLQARENGLVNIGPFLAPNPSARLISKTVIFRNESAEEEPFTHILMQWGQFLDHDLDFSPELEPEFECGPCVFTDICEPIRVPKDDPTFGLGTPNNANCLRFARSLPACDESRPGEFLPREQVNELTSYLDASNVYGSNEIFGNAVREFKDGLLRVGKNFPLNLPSLPQDSPIEPLMACLNQPPGACFLAGDIRANEQFSLTVMHTIWLREHNRIAGELKQINPFWNDDRIFQEARRIVGALMQKITYDDYLPKVLGPNTFNQIIGPYPGYDPAVDAGIPNSFATAAYRYGHSLIRPAFARLDSNFKPIARGPLNLVDAFFNPDQFEESLGTDPIIRGLITEFNQRFDVFVNFVLTTQLFRNAQGLSMDLASLNIQRGRDHGLPPYIVYKRFCETVFPNLRANFEGDVTLIRFLQLYGDLDTLDLWIAGLAEERLPQAFFGATFACIFGITFSNVRNGDRFWYENQNPPVFTLEQVSSIKQDSLSRVLCDNTDNIIEIQPDAFLGNQRRVPCSLLPRVNLKLWREQGCFAQVAVEPQVNDVTVTVFSRAASRQNTFFTQQFRASRQRQVECMAVACPTTTSDCKVLATTDDPTSFFFPNSGLTPNRLKNPISYEADWSKSFFDQQTGGVFTSLAACQSSQTSALDIRKGAVTQSDELASSQQSQDDMMDEYKKFFHIDNKKPMSKAAAADVDSDKVATDQELASELEKALKSLQL